jgi:hypothetical protein
MVRIGKEKANTALQMWRGGALIELLYQSPLWDPGQLASAGERRPLLAKEA